MGYVIYEIDDDKFWQGGRNWTYEIRKAWTFSTVGECRAAMNGLYNRSSTYNLMYKKVPW